MEPLLGELRIFAFGMIPRGWAACDGTLLSISQNSALFSLLGTVYGGNGTSSFALPDLRGRVPMHFDPNFSQGMASGTNATTLTMANLPVHTHNLVVSPAPAALAPAAGNFLAATTANEFGPKNALVAMAASSIGITGNAIPVSNMQPYLGVSICIAVQGIFPSRS